jgi:PAS domain S-box-containing protein
VNSTDGDNVYSSDIASLTTGSLSAADADAEPVRLLLVEDNQDDLFLTRRAFRAAAPHVTLESARSGQEAIEKTAKSQYDVVVVDYQLPDLSGMDVLFSLVEQDIPVIMVTGQGDERVAVQALKSGAADYLVKDVGYLRRLPQAVLGAVERSRLSRENRKLIAQTARQASLLEAVLDTDPAAVAVFRGRDLRLELINPTLRNLVPGLVESEVLGKTLDDLFSEYYTSEMRAMIDNVFSTGTPYHTDDIGFPSRYGGERYFKIHLMPLNASAPEVERGVAAIMWETTEGVQARKRIEELAQQAAAQRDWLQGVIDQMPEGVHIATAPEANLLLVNRAAAEILGPHPVADLSREDVPVVYGLFELDGSRPAVEDLPLQRALWRGETTIGKELRHVRANGTEVDLLVNSAPLYDANGKIMAGVSVFQDITRLKDLDRMKDEFLSISSHELRTPLTNLHAAAQLLLKRARQNSYPQPQVALIATIVQQAERMTRLIEELLDVSRLQSGRLHIQPAPFDLVALVREVVEHSRLSNSQYTIELRAKGQMWVEADRDRIAQVLGNLLDNAVKYSGQSNGGKIEVSVEKLADKQVARIQVSDDGLGFDPRQSEQLFERFSRLGGVAHHSRGMGLGLFISRQLIAAHGGTISASSPGPGLGATFTVELPLARI